MKLYLTQHAEACSAEVDPERPLTDRGEWDIERMAEVLAQAGVRPERVIHSGKLRAAQTAERLAAKLAPDAEVEVSGLMAPNDNPQAFDWQSGSWDRDCLVVGHLPFMARLVAHLVVDDAERGVVAYVPGSVVCLERDRDERWQIAWMLRPQLVSG